MALVNPLMPGFNPDPSMVRVGDTYYLVTSTFEYMPGIPVYASQDLEGWTQIGNVLTRMEQGELADAPTAGGVWAPTIRHRDGRFYVIVTIAMGRGCVVFSTEDPAGEWDDGVLFEDIEGIDPDLNWDDAGVAFVTYSGLVTKGEDFGTHTGIRQVDVDLATGAVLSEKRSIQIGVGGMFPEAPHVYRRGDWWYLMIAEGGTERGHSVSIARSRSPRGPFENGPANPILTARGTDRPIQNTGHGDLVEKTDGTWMMVLLGVRPRGAVRAFSALGRETFHTTVRWVDDWPEADIVELNPRDAVGVEPIDLGRALDAGWMAVRRRPTSLVDQVTRPGWLVLHGEGHGLDDPHPVFVGRRQRHQTAELVVRVDASEGSGGIAVRYDEQNVYRIGIERGREGATVVASARIPDFERRHEIPLPEGEIELVVASVRPPQDDFLAMITCDRVRLAVRTSGEETLLLEVDGRHLTSETACSFTGRVLGLYATHGQVAFADWRYTGSDE